MMMCARRYCGEINNENENILLHMLYSNKCNISGTWIEIRRGEERETGINVRNELICHTKYNGIRSRASRLVQKYK